MRIGLGIALLLATAALAGCGDDTTPATDAAGHPAPAAGSTLLSVAQATEAARDWWARDEQVLSRRPGAPPLTQVELSPAGAVTALLLQDSVLTARPVIAAPRQPQAVRVYVPAQQAWPVIFLAVVDVAATNGGGVQHEAALLVKRDAASPVAAQATAVLDGAEPAFDVDANGYVATRSGGADLSRGYAAYMDAAIQGHPLHPAAFAPGRLTSDLAGNEAQQVADTPGKSHGVISSAEIAYADTAFAVPVFGLRGGGGFALVAVQRVETIHPAAGQQFSQDAARHNWGADLAPGAYAQISRRSFVVLAMQLPGGGAAIDVVGSGGGAFSVG